MRLGDCDITPFVERPFRLDGGSMFGVVPKAIWQTLLPADGENRIAMVTNLFVLRGRGAVTLFDAGFGDTLTPREEKIYGVESASGLEEGLAGLGLAPADVTRVVLSHLHTDHAAGAVRRADGRFVPRFPGAVYVAHRREWEAAMHPNERTAAVYSPERLQALADAGQVQFIEGDTVLSEGLRAVPTGGHTEGHFGLEIEGGGRKVWYYADLFPTAAHLKPAYVPAADLYPLETMAVKLRLLPRIVAEGVILAVDHDTAMPLATLAMEGTRTVARSVEQYRQRHR